MGFINYNKLNMFLFHFIFEKNTIYNIGRQKYVFIKIFKPYSNFFLQKKMNFDNYMFKVYLSNNTCNNQFSDNFSLILRSNTNVI